MAGYITHQEASTQIFGYKDKLNFWQNVTDINFEENKSDELCTG
jgi:hypothetical protein